MTDRDLVELFHRETPPDDHPGCIIGTYTKSALIAELELVLQGARESPSDRMYYLRHGSTFLHIEPVPYADPA